jgi:hypothetical protein
MRKLLLAAAVTALAVCAPAAALAQAAPIVTIPDRSVRAEPRERPEGGRPARSLFISPSGEPFRGKDGLAEWFAQADADRDGALTAAEFEADAQRAFKLYDTDGDGIVDGFEIQAWERERVPELGEVMLGGFEGDGARRKKRRDKDRGEGPPKLFTPAGAMGAARFSLINEPQPLLAADADVDGKVSAAEWKAATARRYAELDKARTGRITLENLRPQPEKK